MGKRGKQHQHHAVGMVRKVCHKGVTKVMTIGKTEIWAGGLQDVGDSYELWDFMLRIGNDHASLPHPSLVRANAKARKMLSPVVTSVRVPAILDIAWDDFGAPTLSRSWWEALNERILSWGPGRMVVHCLGGHGRTGTALAILAGLNDFHIKDKVIDPVEWVRQKYCRQVVEGYGQTDYIEAMTGHTIKSKPSWSVWQSLPKHGALTKKEVDSVTVDLFPKGTADVNDFTGSNRSKEVVIGGDVYAEDEKGDLEYVGPDDGSYYGHNHDHRTSPYG